MTTNTEAMALAQKGICIVCGATFDPKTLKRGLCTTDYNQFIAEAKKLSHDRRVAFESLLMEKGMLLKSRRGKRRLEDNVFKDELSRFLDEVQDSRTRQMYVEGAEAMNQKKKPRKK